MISFTKYALAATAMLGASACASTFDLVETQTDTALSSFEKVYIAPVETDLSGHPVRRSVRDVNRTRPVSERDQSRKASELTADLEREFAKHYILVDAPGPDVLTVGTTLTKLVSTRPTIADRSLPLGIDFSSVYLGGADYQVSLVANETVLATIEEETSSNSSFNDGLPRVGIWQDVDRSFNRFSRKLVSYVESN